MKKHLVTKNGKRIQISDSEMKARAKAAHKRYPAFRMGISAGKKKKTKPAAVAKAKPKKAQVTAEKSTVDFKGLGEHFKKQDQAAAQGKREKAFPGASVRQQDEINAWDRVYAGKNTKEQPKPAKTVETAGFTPMQIAIAAQEQAKRR